MVGRECAVAWLDLLRMMSLGLMSILSVWCTGKVQFCKGHSKCTQCGVYQRQSLADFVKADFWPGTPDGNRIETIIDQRVFQRFAALKDLCNCLPKLG